MTRAEFLDFIEEYIRADPETAAHVADHVQAGLRKALNQARERAADMEVALMALAVKRYKGANEIVHDKLKKWEGYTSLRWDWLLEVIKGDTP